MSDKTCTKCGISKSHDAFGKDRTRKDGRFPHCKECIRVYRQSERGAKLHRESNLRFQQTDKGKACLRRAQKRYQQSAKGAEMYRQSARRRIARKRRVACLSDEELEIIKRRFHNRCFKCDDEIALEVDHHMPLADGYGLTLDNAVLLCRSCNARKGKQHPNKFYSQEQLVTLSRLMS